MTFRTRRADAQVSPARPSYAAEPLEPRLLLSAATAAATPTVSPVGLDASLAVFAENAGQWDDPSVRFAAQTGAADVAFTADGPRFRLSQPVKVEGPAPASEPIPVNAPASPLARSSPTRSPLTSDFSASFPGAARVTPVGLDAGRARFNYYLGNDPAAWRSNVATYAGVAYPNLWAGIDLHAYSKPDGLKYEFVVAPGADPSQVSVRYAGLPAARPLEIESDGSLTIHTPAGDLTDAAPVLYQEVAGKRVEVAGRFELVDARTYTIRVEGDWDKGRALVLDPELAWGTFLGGSGRDFASGIAATADGGVAVVGGTGSTDFPAAGGFDAALGGFDDAFISVLTASGSLKWATFFGGSGRESGGGICSTSDGGLAVTGSTSSFDFPVLDGFDRTYNGNGDAFVAKLASDGSLVWSSFLGGANNSDAGNSIAATPDGGVAVTGYTGSADFPVSTGLDSTFNGGNFDAFVAKVSAGGSLTWATYLGGSSLNTGNGIAALADGELAVTGQTQSADFPSLGGFDATQNGSDDGFVAMLKANGSLIWSTFLGGSSVDYGTAVAATADGGVAVVGITQSTDFPTLGGFEATYNGGNYDAFVLKLAASGSLLWSTYLGGSGGEYGIDLGDAIVATADGGVAVTGRTGSATFPTTDGFDATYNGGFHDAFVSRFTTEGTLAWSTYLGGSGDDGGSGIAVTTDGSVAVTGYTGSANFPTPRGFDTTYNGGVDGPGTQDAFVVKITDGPATPLRPDLVVESVNFTPASVASGGQVRASFRVRNAGTAAAPATKARLRLSVDTKLTSADLPLAPLDVDVPAVAGGAFADVAVDVTVPAGTPAGAYYLGVFADALGTAGQSDTTNDAGLSATRLQVTAAPAALGALAAEVLAKRAVYLDDWAEGERVAGRAEFAGFGGVDQVVRKVFKNTATGFYALGLDSPTSGPELVVRGTDGVTDILDMVSNSDRRGIGYNQFQAALAGVKQWVGAQAGPVDLLGHSLGGALAQWFASALTAGGTAVDQIVTFNSPGISGGTGLLGSADTFVPARAGKVDHYVVEGDLVSLAGQKFLPGSVHLASFGVLTNLTPIGGVTNAGKIILEKHLRPVLADSLVGRGSRPSGLTFTNTTSADLSRASFKYDDPDFNAMLAGIDLSLQIASAGTFLGFPITSAALQRARQVPAKLAQGRGPTEAARKDIGTAVQLALRAATFTRDAANAVRLQLDERAGDFAELTHLTFDPPRLSVTATGSPPVLRAAGDFGVSIGRAISVNVPFYGKVTADHLLDVARGTASTTVGGGRVVSRGEISVLNGLFTADGTMTTLARTNYTRVAGQIDLAQGLVSGSGSIDLNGRGVQVRVAGALHVPAAVKLIGGKTLAGGGGFLDLSLDGDPTNDSLVLYGDFLGVRASFTYRLNADGGLAGIPAVSLGRAIDAVRPLARAAAARAVDGAVVQKQFVAPERGYLAFTAALPEGGGGTVELVTPSGRVLTAADWAADPGIAAEVSSDGVAVRVNSPEQGLWTVRVSGASNPAGVEISAFGEFEEPTALVTGVSGGADGAAVKVGYAVSGVPDGGATLRLIARGTGDLADLQFIVAEQPLAGDAAGTLAWDVADVPLGNYDLVLEVTGGDGVPREAASHGSVTVSRRPQVIDARFAYETGPQRVELQFDRDPTAALAAADFSLVNLTTRQAWPADKIQLTIDPAGPKAVVSFADAALPDGNWRLTVAPNRVSDLHGNATPGGFSFDFFTLAGDLDRNRAVNAADLAALQAHLGLASGATYSDGDLNYDGRVDEADLELLRANLGKNLPPVRVSFRPPSRGALLPARPPIAVPVRPLPLTLAAARTPRPAGLFATRLIGFTPAAVPDPAADILR